VTKAKDVRAKYPVNGSQHNLTEISHRRCIYSDCGGGLCICSNQTALMVKVQFRKATKPTLPFSSTPTVRAQCDAGIFASSMPRCGGVLLVSS